MYPIVFCARIWNAVDSVYRIYPKGGAQLYSQVSEAVPLTVMDVFCTPLFTVKVRF